jgi:hypothetical protein
MGLAEARTHVSSCAELAAILPRRIDWLAAQAALDPAHRHPLYDWLELPDAFPETLESVRSLCAALRAPVGGDTGSRRRRLTSSDRADYHSAMCELYMAATLVKCGLSTTLGNPDLTVQDATGSLFLELTSAQRTADLAMLQVALTDALGAYSAGAQLDAAHDTLRLTTDQRERIVGAAVAVAGAGPLEPTSVDLEAIIPGRDLRLAIMPSQPYVGLQDASVFGGTDPMLLIEAAIADKAKQLRDVTPVILGVELTGSDWGSHLWAIRVAFGEVPVVSIPARPGLVGVLAYWRGRGSLRPYMRVWLPNDAWRGPIPPLTVRVLECLSGPE